MDKSELPPPDKKALSKSVTNFGRMGLKSVQGHRRKISVMPIPTENLVNDSIFNMPRNTKKTPQAFLFGRSLNAEKSLERISM